MEQSLVNCHHEGHLRIAPALHAGIEVKELQPAHQGSLCLTCLNTHVASLSVAELLHATRALVTAFQCQGQSTAGGLYSTALLSGGMQPGSQFGPLLVHVTAALYERAALSGHPSLSTAVKTLVTALCDEFASADVPWAAEDDHSVALLGASSSALQQSSSTYQTSSATSGAALAALLAEELLCSLRTILQAGINDSFGVAVVLLCDVASLSKTFCCVLADTQLPSLVGLFAQCLQTRRVAEVCLYLLYHVVAACASSSARLELLVNVVMPPHEDASGHHDAGKNHGRGLLLTLCSLMGTSTDDEALLSNALALTELILSLETVRHALAACATEAHTTDIFQTLTPILLFVPCCVSALPAGEATLSSLAAEVLMLCARTLPCPSFDTIEWTEDCAVEALQGGRTTRAETALSLLKLLEALLPLMQQRPEENEGEEVLQPPVQRRGGKCGAGGRAPVQTLCLRRVHTLLDLASLPLSSAISNASNAGAAVVLDVAAEGTYFAHCVRQSRHECDEVVMSALSVTVQLPLLCLLRVLKVVMDTVGEVTTLLPETATAAARAVLERTPVEWEDRAPDAFATLLKVVSFLLPAAKPILQPFALRLATRRCLGGADEHEAVVFVSSLAAQECLALLPLAAQLFVLFGGSRHGDVTSDGGEGDASASDLLVSIFEVLMNASVGPWPDARQEQEAEAGRMGLVDAITCGAAIPTECVRGVRSCAELLSQCQCCCHTRVTARMLVSLAASGFPADLTLAKGDLEEMAVHQLLSLSTSVSTQASSDVPPSDSQLETIAEAACTALCLCAAYTHWHGQLPLSMAEGGSDSPCTDMQGMWRQMMCSDLLFTDAVRALVTYFKRQRGMRSALMLTLGQLLTFREHAEFASCVCVVLLLDSLPSLIPWLQGGSPPRCDGDTAPVICEGHVTELQWMQWARVVFMSTATETYVPFFAVLFDSFKGSRCAYPSEGSSDGNSRDDTATLVLWLLTNTVVALVPQSSALPSAALQCLVESYLVSLVLSIPLRSFSTVFTTRLSEALTHCLCRLPSTAGSGADHVLFKWVQRNLSSAQPLPHLQLLYVLMCRSHNEEISALYRNWLLPTLRSMRAQATVAGTRCAENTRGGGNNSSAHDVTIVVLCSVLEYLLQCNTVNGFSLPQRWHAILPLTALSGMWGTSVADQRPHYAICLGALEYLLRPCFIGCSSLPRSVTATAAEIQAGWECASQVVAWGVAELLASQFRAREALVAARLLYYLLYYYQAQWPNSLQALSLLLLVSAQAKLPHSRDQRSLVWSGWVLAGLMYIAPHAPWRSCCTLAHSLAATLVSQLEEVERHGASGLCCKRSRYEDMKGSEDENAVPERLLESDTCAMIAALETSCEHFVEATGAAPIAFHRVKDLFTTSRFSSVRNFSSFAVTGTSLFYADRAFDLFLGARASQPQ